MLVRLKLPLTLAIVPALIVRSAGKRYAVPQANLLELVRLEVERHAGVVHVAADQLLDWCQSVVQPFVGAPGKPRPWAGVVDVADDGEDLGLFGRDREAHVVDGAHPPPRASSSSESSALRVQAAPRPTSAPAAMVPALPVALA